MLYLKYIVFIFILYICITSSILKNNNKSILNMVPEPFTVNSENGIKLACKLWKSNNLNNNMNDIPIVLFIHQYAIMGGQGILMEGMAKHTVTNGFNAITFDLRGAGQSTGSPTYTNQYELTDVKEVINYIIKNFDSNKIFIVGSSGGAPLCGAILDYSPRIDSKRYRYHI